MLTSEVMYIIYIIYMHILHIYIYIYITLLKVKTLKNVHIRFAVHDA